MEEYEKECQKRKARADKFGTTYVPPKLEDYLPWSEAKRIQQQPSKGFATGMDLMDAEEIARKEARKARFANSQLEDGKDKGTDEQETKDNGENDDVDNDGVMERDSKEELDLPVYQAWDKEELLRPQRSDPPPSLWNTPPPEGEQLQNKNSQKEGAEEKQDESEKMADSEVTAPVSWTPEKIHMFSIDWAAFKQIRNKDIMSWFDGYGPTYVEWLADLSCNVCFEDKFTASRALMNLSREIPSPPLQPSPPSPQLTTPEPSSMAQNPQDEATPTVSPSTAPLPDFGNMTWRFCRKPIRKVADDRYGRKGTTARVLMRLALSSDILQDRPNSWPAPPGGFSSTKVLGPDSDYKGGKKGKKTNNNNNKNNNQEKDMNNSNNNKKKKRQRGKKAQGKQTEGYISHDREDEEHPMLARGLSAGRQGFSVEELEQERAQKRQKQVE